MMSRFSNEMKRAVMIDYAHLNKKCNHLKNILLDKHVRIETDLGTNISFDLMDGKI